MYPFPECTSIAVSGATVSGKSFWTYRFLREKDVMFSSPPEKVLYCYGIYQPLFEKMEKELLFVTFYIKAYLTRTYCKVSLLPKCNLVILDDLMSNVTSSVEMENLFVKGVHHLHLSVLYINQNIFCKGKHSHTINLNTYIFVLMEIPRDVSQLQCLARQAFLGKSNFLMEAYKDATSKHYGYLVLDFSPGTIDDYRVSPNVFLSEDTVIYQPV